MSRIETTRIGSHILGKTTSYRLNAYDDAMIAQMLVDHVRTAQEPNGAHSVSKRAARLITQTPGERKRQRLIGQAFTQFHINGYADLMTARFYEEFSGLDPIVKDGCYAHEEQIPVNLFFWDYLWHWDMEPLYRYSLRNTDLTLQLTKSQIVQEFVRVQEENIAANVLAQSQILNNQQTFEPKVMILREVSRQTAYPQAFLRGAAGTQSAASKWDRFFVNCLKWRHGGHLDFAGATNPARVTEGENMS